MNIVIIVLAIWRVTRLVGDPREAGPYNLLDKMRTKVGIVYNEFSVLEGENEFARGLVCVYCLSVWLGILAAIAYLAAPAICVAIAMPFALSAGAIIIEGAMNGRI